MFDQVILLVLHGVWGGRLPSILGSQLLWELRGIISRRTCNSFWDLPIRASCCEWTLTSVISLLSGKNSIKRQNSSYFQKECCSNAFIHVLYQSLLRWWVAPTLNWKFVPVEKTDKLWCQCFSWVPLSGSWLFADFCHGQISCSGMLAKTRHPSSVA